MPETGDAQLQAQNPAAAALQDKFNQGTALHQQGDWQTQSAFIGMFCACSQITLVRCICSVSSLFKLGTRSGQ